MVIQKLNTEIILPNPPSLKQRIEWFKRFHLNHLAQVIEKKGEQSPGTKFSKEGIRLRWAFWSVW